MDYLFQNPATQKMELFAKLINGWRHLYWTQFVLLIS